MQWPLTPGPTWPSGTDPPRARASSTGSFFSHWRQGPAKMGERGIGAAGEGLGAREARTASPGGRVVARGRSRERLHRPRSHRRRGAAGRRTRPPTVTARRRRRAARRLQGPAFRAPHAGMAPHEGILDEDDGAGRRVQGLTVERERRAPAQDDVHLLVPKRRLGGLLDHVVAGVRGDVGVDPERTDAERPANRSPQECALHDGNRLDLLEPDAPPGRHEATLPSGTPKAASPRPSKSSCRARVPASRRSARAVWPA